MIYNNESEGGRGNVLSMYAAGAVLALALLSFQSAAQTKIGPSIEEFIRTIEGNMGGSFELTDDIDGKGKEFVIGSDKKRFRGTLDGKGKSIYNINMVHPSVGYIGVFGYLDKGAVIKNLGVVADTVRGNFAVGVLAGGSDGVIENCFTKGVVIANTNSAGGLVGLNGGVISGSYSEASVQGGGNNVGGLVGLQTVNVSGAGITNSYAAGAVTGADNVGGLVGYVFGGSVRQCIASGKVTGKSNAGGLIGYDYGSANASAGWKTSGKTGTGEAVRKADVVHCVWDREATGQNGSAGATGKDLSEGITTKEINSSITYRDWDITDIWKTGDGHPYLINAPSDPSFKSSGEDVGAPEREEVTRNSIKIKPVTAGNGQQVEYAISQSAVAPESGWEIGKLEFGGLAQNTTYYIFARSAGNREYNTGKPSEPLVAKTEEAPTSTEYVFEPSVDKESVTLGDSVTLSVNVESPNGGELKYQWYWNNFNTEIFGGSEEIEGATSPSYKFAPTETRYYFVEVVNTYTDDAGKDTSRTFRNVEGIRVAVSEPLNKKPVLSAAAAPGVIVKGRTLVMPSPSAYGVQVRVIDIRGRTAARFVSGRGASFSLSGLPVGRYVVEVRERGKRVSASPVFLR